MSNSIRIPEIKLELHEGDVIYLKNANNGKYITVKEDENIQASVTVPDKYCKHTVVIHNDLTISLRADNNKYWSRIGDTNIKASKVIPDQYSKFKVMQLCNIDDNTYMALQADTDKWLSRMGHANIAASKDGIDQFCEILVEVFAPK